LPKGRRWIYVVIDVRTRLILSVKVCAAPNTEDAIAALGVPITTKASLMHSSPASNLASNWAKETAVRSAWSEFRRPAGRPSQVRLTLFA
jgi:hypothetical protein